MIVSLYGKCYDSGSNYIGRMAVDHFPEKGGGIMVTYATLIEILISFGMLIATSLAVIVAIIALIVADRNKK